MHGKGGGARGRPGREGSGAQHAAQQPFALGCCPCSPRVVCPLAGALGLGFWPGLCAFRLPHRASNLCCTAPPPPTSRGSTRLPACHCRRPPPFRGPSRAMDLHALVLRRNRERDERPLPHRVFGAPSLLERPRPVHKHPVHLHRTKASKARPTIYKSPGQGENPSPPPSSRSFSSSSSRHDRGDSGERAGQYGRSAGRGPWRRRSCTSPPPSTATTVRDPGSLPFHPSPAVLLLIYSACACAFLTAISLAPFVCAGADALLKAALDGNLSRIKGSTLLLAK